MDMNEVKYCNIYVVGNNNVGKTTLISNIISDSNTISNKIPNSRRFKKGKISNDNILNDSYSDIEINYNTKINLLDWIIREDNIEIRIDIKESISRYLNPNNSGTFTNTIFIIVIDPSVDKADNIYSNIWFKRIRVCL